MVKAMLAKEYNLGDPKVDVKGIDRFDGLMVTELSMKEQKISLCRGKRNHSTTRLVHNGFS